MKSWSDVIAKGLYPHEPQRYKVPITEDRVTSDQNKLNR